MNDENIILLTDEDGEEIPYELLDDMILDDRRFVILAPAYADDHYIFNFHDLLQL